MSCGVFWTLIQLWLQQTSFILHYQNETNTVTHSHQPLHTFSLLLHTYHFFRAEVQVPMVFICLCVFLFLLENIDTKYEFHCNTNVYFQTQSFLQSSNLVRQSNPWNVDRTLFASLKFTTSSWICIYSFHTIKHFPVSQILIIAYNCSLVKLLHFQASETCSQLLST